MTIMYDENCEISKIIFDKGDNRKQCLESLLTDIENASACDARPKSTYAEIAILTAKIKRELEDNPLYTRNELSLKLNVSARKLDTAFYRIHVEGYSAYHAEQIKREIMRLYASGLSQKEISERLSITDKTVRRYCSAKVAKQQQGAYTHRKKGSIKTTKWETIKPLLDEGKTYVEIASTLGCTKQNIQRVCKLNGYRRNK